MKRVLSVSFLALLSVSPTVVSAQLAEALFQDHMVLQRDVPIRIFGEVEPGESVTIELAGRTTDARVDVAGLWLAELPPIAAGGPYELTIRSSGGVSGTVQTLRDVLIGDVFLCSGQSNMEMSVLRALDSWSEIHGAGNDRIRMTKVGRAAEPMPQWSYPEPLVWESATPETVGDWSAACYFFARELQKVVDVPLGLIDASWGGSDVRAWMSDLSLAEVDGYDEAIELLRLYAVDEWGAQRRFGESWQSWWREEATEESTEETTEKATAPWQPASGTEWTPAPEGLGNWKSWGVPELESFDGMVWYRATFELTAEQAARDGELVLGGVDEVDQTWINGRILGNTFGWGDVRSYVVVRDRLREGENVVVTNVFSAWDHGGLVGDSQREIRFADPDTGEVEAVSLKAVPLEGWRYQRVEAPHEPPRAPWESIAGRTTLYNAMIAPLRNLQLRGALWYQGESNTPQGLDYAPLLQSMIDGWRSQLRDDLPFLVVQLAGFGARNTEPTESGLANVREAQRLVARDDPKTTMVTAIDVGDVYDIHPPNKQEVGRRLARAARHLIYGEDVTPGGPLPLRATRQENQVRVEFDDVVDELVAYGHGHPIGFELCESTEGSCRWAEARIDGTAVVLEGAKPRDVKVRYAWADSPVCTLYDQAGLPAIPFELAIK